MHKRIFRDILLSIGLIGVLAIGTVNAGATITAIDAPGAEGYSGLKFDDGNGHVIMLLDRNLGATTTGAGNNASLYSYGYKYQWGNNYGFEDGCWNTSRPYKGCSDDIKDNATLTKVLYSGSYDNSNYSGSTFIMSSSSPYDYWIDSVVNSGNHMNLWGGGADAEDNNWGIDAMTAENIKNRQGPCPSGYHVPSAGEWGNLLKYRAAAYTGEGNTISDWGVEGGLNYFSSDDEAASIFINKFQIPFAGTRDTFTAKPTYQGSYACLWSSSPISDTNSDSINLYVYEGSVYANGGNWRTEGFPVRCFYDSYLLPQTFTFSFTGSEGGSISTGSVDVEEGSPITINNETGSVQIGDIVVTTTPKEGYTFSGWLTDCVGDSVATGCSFTGEFKAIIYTITYLGIGDNYEPSATGYTIKSEDITLRKPSREGYEFVGWSGTDVEGITGSVIITAGSTGDRIYEAIRTKNSKPSGGSSGGGGGGGGGTTKSDTKKNEQKPEDTSEQVPQNDNNASSGTNVKIPENDIQGETKGDEESSKTSMDSSTSSQNDGKTYSPEFQQAYEFAHEKGITTMSTIQKADMNGKLTRIAMAKMLSQYAINVLGKTPDTTQNNKFNDVTDKRDADYDNGVTLAYQLGIMGQNMPGNNFRPDDEVSRAEFATALSRMLYNTSDGQYKSTDKYYTNHMSKLVKEGIITKDDPKMKELRGYVMIMLMRSAK